MIKRLAVVLFTAAIAASLLAQSPNFKSVSQETLQNPAAEDWLMYSRTYDAQRFSPLTQINRQNAGSLVKIWSQALPDAGTHESIPIVHAGVMYLVVPGGAVQALDAS